MQTPTITWAAMWNCIHILDFQDKNVSCRYPQRGQTGSFADYCEQNCRMKHRAMNHRDMLPMSCSVSH